MSRHWIRGASACALALAGICAGCGGRPEIRFRLADVINAPQGRESRQQLDVDVVCVDSDLAEMHPRLARGVLRSDQWFRLRAHRGEANNLALDVDGDHMYALRGAGDGYANYTPDTVRGPALLSRGDAGGRGSVSVALHDSEFRARSATLLVYGRFSDGKGGLLPTDPVIIPRGGKSTVVIDVGERSLRRAGGEE